VNITAIIAQIDAEIARLQQARQALAAVNSGTVSAKLRGRPPKNPTPVSTQVKRRTLSASARAKIAAAQRKRWAAQKKA